MFITLMNPRLNPFNFAAVWAATKAVNGNVRIEIQDVDMAGPNTLRGTAT